MINFKFLAILIVITSLNIYNIYPQKRDTNYDESKVQPYSLPSILTSHSGVVINNVSDWEKYRRPEILNSFISHVYGRVPGKIDSMKVKVTEKGTYLNGAADRIQVTLTFIKDKKEHSADLLIYLPSNKEKPPIFLGYNFQGNHTIAEDEEIFIT